MGYGRLNRMGRWWSGSRRGWRRMWLCRLLLRSCFSSWFLRIVAIFMEWITWALFLLNSTENDGKIVNLIISVVLKLRYRLVRLRNLSLLGRERVRKVVVAAGTTGSWCFLTILWWSCLHLLDLFRIGLETVIRLLNTALCFGGGWGVSLQFLTVIWFFFLKFLIELIDGVFD